MKRQLPTMNRRLQRRPWRHRSVCAQQASSRHHRLRLSPPWRCHLRVRTHSIPATKRSTIRTHRSWQPSLPRPSCLSCRPWPSLPSPPSSWRAQQQQQGRRRRQAQRMKTRMRKQQPRWQPQSPLVGTQPVEKFDCHSQDQTLSELFDLVRFLLQRLFVEHACQACFDLPARTIH